MKREIQRDKKSKREKSVGNLWYKCSHFGTIFNNSSSGASIGDLSSKLGIEHGQKLDEFIMGRKFIFVDFFGDSLKINK